MNTPWGYSQHSYEITEGVYEVDTAGHGGILVHRLVAAQLLSPEAMAKGWKWDNWYAYEEDCDWAIFAYEQPELYAEARKGMGCPSVSSEETKKIAHDCLNLFHPDYLSEREAKTPQTVE